MKNIYLHIGTHKTGSTAIQAFLQKESKLLNSKGYEFYNGYHLKKNHVELFLSSMRENRDSFSKEKFNIGKQSEYIKTIREKVLLFIKKSDKQNLILSTEGLSLLRYEDELDILRSIIDADNNNVTLILYTRDKKGYMESYKKQIKKNNRPFSNDPESVFYVEQDSWLIDYSSLKEAYANAFGSENLICIDYDIEMKIHGNVLPSFLKSVGCTNYPKGTLNKYFKNVSNGKSTSSKKKATIIGKIINRLKSYF